VAIRERTLLDLLDKAAGDRDFLRRLSEQPLETAHIEGVEIHSGELKVVLGIPGASDDELVEVLRVRLRNASDGCDPCDEDCNFDPPALSV
jgi:hypothetical protein